MENRLKLITLFSLIILSLVGMPAQAKTQTYECAADKTWFTNPSMPIEVKKSAPNGESNFCDFYQFSWQAFIYLMSPSDKESAQRNFQVTSNYPILEVSKDKKPVNSCDDTITENTLFVSLDKAHGLPERIHQAGDSATIYDQQGDVVYYDVRFSRNMCNVADIKTKNNFPSGTTEMKTAWKVLKDGEKDNYLTIVTDVGTQKNVTLGMIGFHLAIATTDHPEFVWATFEQKNNAPDCTNPQPTPAKGWSFTSNQCADLLKKNSVLQLECNFNTAKSSESITGNPTEICRVYAYGTDLTDPNALENVGSITSLNANVAALLSGNMAVFKNYFNVGALWVSNNKEDSSISNQRGSLRLANTVAETTFQNVDLNPKTNQGFASNCFGCHNFEGSGLTTNKNTTSGGLSHIFDDIAAGMGECLDVQAGPIMSNSQAEAICGGASGACGNSSSILKWNGQWTTTVPGKMSVCGCCGS